MNTKAAEDYLKENGFNLTNTIAFMWNDSGKPASLIPSESEIENTGWSLKISDVRKIAWIDGARYVINKLKSDE